MTEISSLEELEEWLKDKPANWAQVIAARAALRVMPIALNDKIFLQNNEIIVSLFYTTSTSWAARNIPAHDMAATFAAARARAGDASADDASADDASAARAHAVTGSDAAIAAVPDAALAAAAAFAAARAAVAARAVSVANTAVAFTARAAVAAGADEAIWQSIEEDADFLQYHDGTDPSKDLSAQSLWLANPSPSNIQSQWLDAKHRMEELDTNFIHWINWYERRLIGHDAAFQIFNDINRTEDKEIIKKIADATNEDFWSKGAEYVNQQLSDWLREARQRAQQRYDAENASKAHKPITDEEIKSSLSSTASPQIQVEDGKLTAAPNQIFDKPQYSDDLANLPAILRTFIDTLVNSLPTQAAPIVRNSLAAYQEELLVRGTQPILPIVKGFASSIAAQVLDNAHDLENTPPDQWTLKDEREWDDGTADLFRTFFKYHLDLINHFPMDKEREEILSNLPIDEEKASGNALIEPIEKVNEIILAMVDKGYASHDIGKIIKAHSQYNRDIAGLLPPSGDVDPKIVTPKRRHVLNTQGLYLNIYNTILATASFANSITPAQIDWIMQSIQTLMGFIIR